MAARKKSSRATMKRGRSKTSGGAGKKKSAGKKRLAAKKKAVSSMKAASAKATPVAKKAKTTMKKAVPAKQPSRAPSKSPMERISSVAVQVVQQAQSAVSEGVDVLREVGTNLAERVSG